MNRKINETVTVKYYENEFMNLHELVRDLNRFLELVPEVYREDATVKISIQDTYVVLVVSYPRPFNDEEQEQYDRIVAREEQFKNCIKFNMKPQDD